MFKYSDIRNAEIDKLEEKALLQYILTHHLRDGKLEVFPPACGVKIISCKHLNISVTRLPTKSVHWLP